MLSSPMRAVSAALALCLLASCQSDGVLPALSTSGAQAGFKQEYLVARAALEKGQFSKAVRGYQGLLGQAGPLEPRLRLEYAHALLRAGKFEKSSEEARVVAAQLDGLGRSAALAVQATADQEIVRRAIDKGRVTPEVFERLVAARLGYDEVLSTHPQLDPLGSLALRRRLLDIEESTLR